MNLNSEKPKINTTLAICICLLASMFYLYEFVLQVAPGVMTTELMRAYSVGAAGLGTISAFYYYAYTPMQLPAGMLYDRFGPRILLPIAVTICALGAVFFGTTHSAILASYGRFMMGFGSAFSFIGTLVLIARWFPPHYFALLAGIAQLMSSVGAVFGLTPLAHAIAIFGWRNSMVTLGIIGIFLAITMWLVVRDYPQGYQPEKKSISKRQTLTGFKYVLSNQQTWLVAFYAFCVWAPIVIFAALWGVPFLEELYGISTTKASTAIAMVWIGIGIASPIGGWISDRIKRRNLILTIGAIIGIVCTTFVVYVPMPFWLIYFFLFGIGIAALGQSLSFGVIQDITPPRFVGTAVGFNNMAVVAGGAFFQPLVGFLLHLAWDGAKIENVPVYNPDAYREALWLLPMCYIVAAILSSMFIKETYCEHIYKTKT